MSEASRMPDPECARAHGLLAEFADDDLPASQAAWLCGHLEACAQCRAALAEFAEIDRELNGWGRQLSLRNPPPGGAREQLAAKMASPAARRTPMRWIPAAAIAAALLVVVTMPNRKPAVVTSAANPSGSRFIEIPYLPPPDPHENSTIVRMNIRVATLISVGYRVTADPDTVVPADVLVGEDGRAYAVRVLSGIEWG